MIVDRAEPTTSARDGDMKREGAWLGPCEHSWPLSTLKRVGRFSAGAGFPDAEQGVQDEELPFYKVSDMNANGNAVYMIESANTVNRATAKRLGATVFAADTIVFPKVGAALLSNKRRILTRPSCVDNNTMGLTITHGWPKYFHYLLTCMDFGLLANPGAVPSLNESQVREIRACLPGESEQRAIANFLDRETQTIDALVAKKQRLVGLLQEKRTALISHAVTKGLDPDVPMKDSGIEWLGAIPAHWDAGVLRRAARLESGHTPSRQHPEYWEDCSVPWFTLADIWQVRPGIQEYVSETNECVSEVGLAHSSARLLQAGTVLLSRTASVGFSAIAERPMATSQDFANWVCGDALLPEYLLYVYQA